MFRIFLILVAICMCIKVFPQSGIANDGKYVFAVIDKSIERNDPVLVIQSTQNRWKKEVKNGSKPMFSADDTRILYMVDDSLFELRMETGEMICKSNISSYKLPFAGHSELLAYQLKNASKGLVLLNMESGKEVDFSNVTNYFFDIVGNRLFVETTTVDSNISSVSLICFDCSNGDKKNIFSHPLCSLSDFVFTPNGQQMAFIMKEGKDDSLFNSIYLYQLKDKQANLLVNDSSNEMEKNLCIAKKGLSFSKNGSTLFFKLKERRLPIQDPNLLQVEVWNYTDAKLQSIQQKDLFLRDYIAAISLKDYHRIIRLQHEDEIVLGYYNGGLEDDRNGMELSDKFGLIAHFNGDIITYNLWGKDNISLNDAYSLQEDNWNKATACSIYLVSTIDGKRELIRSNLIPNNSQFPFFRLSPGEQFVVYFDSKDNNYYSYDINSKKIKNLTQTIKTSWVVKNEEERVRDYFNPVGIFGWYDKDSAVLLYDCYSDIWEINLKVGGIKNITEEFCKRNSVRFVKFNFDYGKSVFHAGDEIFLRSYRNKYKYPLINEGVYNLKLQNDKPLRELIRIGGPIKLGPYFKIASQSNICLFTMESNTHPPTWYYTQNFQKYDSLTSSEKDERIAENKELITWKTLDNKLSQGVLYKPKRFDSTKKYPIIFTYYESESAGGALGTSFYKFSYYGTGNFNDSDYLVFVPDIHFIIGQTGQSVCNCVVSAAKYLMQRKYVDTNKMGIVGGSFGGFETNYLVTHTNLFAAAWSSCGISDLVSAFGSEDKSNTGKTFSSDIEVGQHRFATSLWQRPDIYLKNSPVFYADKVTTPIVLVHGKKDEIVPYAQSIEFFKALRRLGKRAWLLSYNGGHGGEGRELQENGDLERFKIQFFDHYLKGKPAPIWMTRGIPARLKGTTLGLEYDTLIRTPGPGLLMENEDALTPQQKGLLKHKTRVNDEGRIEDIIDDKMMKKKK